MRDKAYRREREQAETSAAFTFLFDQQSIY
jgi:hypothetical protein